MLLASATIIGSSVGISGLPAQALLKTERSESCAGAPGPRGSFSCHHSYASRVDGRHIAKAKSSYTTRAWKTVCEIRSTFKYQKNGTNWNGYRSDYSSHCSLGVGWHDWSPDLLILQEGSQFCSKQKNSQTKGTYTDYRCLTIKK